MVRTLAHGVRDGTRFAVGFKRLMQLVGMMPYGVWYSGSVPDGPMAWAANAPLPSVEAMRYRTTFCAAVPNIIRRDAGKIIPTRGNPHFDGGLAAYFYTPAWELGPGFFSSVDLPFDLPTAKRWARETGSGVLVGRIYRNATLQGQGHVAVVLPDGKVLQSFQFGPGGSPGLNDYYTIEQSNAGGYYELMIHPRDWINHDVNDWR